VIALFPRLAERRRQTARTMSGGEQQMVAIGRAMMSAPTILMLDEPSLGLSPILCSELFKSLAEVRKTGAGILLVEQNARQGLAIADRGYLLENGRIVGEGSAKTLAQDPAVQKAYLGGAAGDISARPAPRPAQAPAESVGRAAVPTPARAGAVPARVVEQLIPGTIDDLVKRAAAIQSEHVRATRSERVVARPIVSSTNVSSTDTRGDSLREAIARVEAAAAGARKAQPGRQPGERGESGQAKGD
jgi:branched-chain amino acid transport system ATP-binding protein